MAYCGFHNQRETCIRFYFKPSNHTMCDILNFQCEVGKPIIVVFYFIIIMIMMLYVEKD